MKILLVDQEAISALSIASELHLAGHSVIGPASSSSQALSLSRQYHQSSLSRLSTRPRSGRCPPRPFLHCIA
jgi:hypothetical protein